MKSRTYRKKNKNLKKCKLIKIQKLYSFDFRNIHTIKKDNKLIKKDEFKVCAKSSEI